MNLGNADHRQRQLELERERQLQLRRKQRGRKQNSKGKGHIIRPQEQPGLGKYLKLKIYFLGYVGDKEVDDIMKTLGFEQSGRKAQKANSNSSSNGTDNSSCGAEKTAKKQNKRFRKISKII